MAGRTSSPYFSADDGEVKIKIKKPALNTARAVRDAILRDYFGYTKTDIEELDRQQPGKFYIRLEGDNSGKEMTPEQVRDWYPDSGGMLSVAFDQYWIKNLTAFREQRVVIVLSQSLGAISDAEVRTEVLGVLEKILKSTGNDRIMALNNLIAIGSSNGSVSDALGFLIAQEGYSGNPFLLLARARLDTINYTTKSGPGYDTLIQPLLLQAIKKANESFNSVAANSSSPARNREDATYINRQAAWMFAQIGKDREFQEHDWLARFYEMSAEERAALREGDTIHIVAPGVNVMSTPRPQTEAEKDLKNVDSGMQQTRKTWAEMDKAKAINETSDPRSVDRTEILPNITNTTEIKGSSFPNQQKKDAYPRGQNQRNLPPGKTEAATYGTRWNQSSINNANYWGGGADLINKWANAITFRVRIEIVTRYIAEKERLENKIAAERVTVVPPKPALIEKTLADFRRHGQTTVNPFEKERILKIIPKLEQLRERSYAMWKEKK